MPSIVEQIHLITQNLPAAAVPQINFLNRIELQNVAAMSAVNEKEEEIEDLNDVDSEEIFYINPDIEHERERQEIAYFEKEEETIKNIKKREEKKIKSSPYHLLDIKV